VIGTASNPDGEIRGQLVPATGPTLVCPGNLTIECNGQTTNLTAQVSSATGEALTVTWAVNGVNVQTNLVPQGSTTNVAVVLAANLALGTNIVAVTVADTTGGLTSCQSTIVVQDTIAPVITNKTISPAVLWPPNHKMVPIKISVATNPVVRNPNRRLPPPKLPSHRRRLPRVRICRIRIKIRSAP